ncbi:hypothetical protein ACKESD_12330 [Acinetobacter baumannii]|uniref:hypothetical protein n=1 Tax=Acinetobacter baumannii TaxID=470 RepID=UPI0004A00320|nr:hypothetical protein [Acinetobacter baumannii]KCX74625.1 hypothetical protein J560_1990 [Acinetobacter baumannii 855125]MDA5807504.1 hypothetical protein [Acinetobacter baumannii]HEO1810306.1 hypothetical protein [Acinetobacter baumannii]
MSNNNVGIEINGGGNIQATDGKINIKGGGKGIVSNESYNNTFTRMEINITAQNELMFELKDIINQIDDSSKNPLTHQTYKTDSLSKIDEILSNPNDKIANIANLTAILTAWMTSCNYLVPQIQPYLEPLYKLLSGG